ncbi:MAG: hypothetical protein JOZ43_03550 [Acidobacteriales bacterium]|nr:hypothetical protein [Terriglobales bacterium]
MSGLALIQLSHINLGIDFDTAMWWRIDQAACIAFLFVPINTISYVGVPQEQNNQVSGMVNLMRNIGSSVGISMFVTLLARRTQVHQNYLAKYSSDGSTVLSTALTGIERRMVSIGADPFTAQMRAMRRIEGMLQMQSTVLSYRDVILLFALISFLAVPIVFIAKRNKPGQASMGH